MLICCGTWCRRAVESYTQVVPRCPSRWLDPPGAPGQKRVLPGQEHHFALEAMLSFFPFIGPSDVSARRKECQCKRHQLACMWKICKIRARQRRAVGVSYRRAPFWESHVPLTTCSRRAAMELATKVCPPRGSQWRQHLFASEDFTIARSCRDFALPDFLSGSCE